jgi:hypothetical protein
MGALSCWKTASLLGNNVWIMGCNWLPNMSTYFLTVVRPWRMIWDQRIPRHCCPNHHRTSPPPHFSLLEFGFSDCRLPWVFSKCKLFLMEGTTWRTTHLTITRARFQLSHVHVLWSWHHGLLNWALLSVIRCLATAALPWMLDWWTSHRTVFVRTKTSRWIFSSSVTCAPVVLSFQNNPSQSTMRDLFLSVLIFTHRISSLVLSSHDLCMPT